MAVSKPRTHRDKDVIRIKKCESCFPKFFHMYYLLGLSQQLCNAGSKYNRLGIIGVNSRTME